MLFTRVALRAAQCCSAVSPFTAFGVGSPLGWTWTKITPTRKQPVFKKRSLPAAVVIFKTGATALPVDKNLEYVTGLAGDFGAVPKRKLAVLVPV